MKAYFNEDEILMLLNEVNIKEEELSSMELPDIEKRRLRKNVLKKIKGNVYKRRKWLTVASLVFICITVSISKPTFAETTFNVINSLIFGDNKATLIDSLTFGNNKAIEKAVENNYIQPLSITSVHNSGIEIKPTNILIDKTKLALSFDVKFDDPKLLTNVQIMSMDLEVIDEKGKVLLAGTDTDLSGKKVLKVITSSTDNFQILTNSTSQLRYFNIANSSEGKIPEVNKLDINIKSVRLINKGSTEVKTIPGPWSFETDVSDIFKDNKSINFVAKNKDKEIKIKTVEVTTSGTLIRFTLPRKVGIDIFNNVKIEDSKGEIQSIAGVVNSEDSYFNTTLYSMTFPITTFDNPDSLKLVFKDYKRNDIEIQLVKK